MFNLNYNFMAKFNEKQVLDLFRLELQRRLKADEEYLPKDLPNFRLIMQSRISLLRDLIDSLDFYVNYEFD